MKSSIAHLALAGSFLLAFAACSGSKGGDNAGGDGSGNGNPNRPGADGGGGDGGPGACVPKCGGKTCGDDGCGGSCGSCGVYQRCDDKASVCVAAGDLTPLDANKTIDLNLGVANVTGKIAWNGGALPVGLTNGRVRFVDKTSGSVTTVPLAATYTARLYAGTYAIAIDTQSAGDPTVPAQVATVKDGVVVSADAAIDLAVTTATVSGTVSVDGAAPPEGGSTRGRVFLKSAGGGQVTATVAASGAATYSLPVFAGTYDVGYDSRGLPGAMPDQSAVARKAVVVAGATTADVALTTTTLTGTLTQNGAALPSETSHGTVLLSAPDFSTVSTAVATSGPATYALQVYAGTYDLAFDSRSSTSLPDQTVSLATARALSGSQTANFDVKVVDVTGKVTLNGAALGDSGGQSRGSVDFVSPTGAGTVSALLASTGAATYTAHLYAGTYDVRIRAGSSQTVLPQQTATVKKAQAFTQSSPLDVDLATAHVHGTVTVDGAALADEPSARGSVTFVERSTGDRFDIALGPSGAATYDAVVFAGTYGVEFRSSSSSTVLPQQTTHVLDKKLAGDVALDVPLKTLTATGVVKMNGQDLPNETAASSRGTVVFVDKLTGARVDQTVGATGPATYSVRLFDGGYDVHFDTSSSQTALPVADDRVLSGCVPVDASCSLSDKDLGGAWLLDFTGWGTMDLSLIQNGNALGGYATSTWGSGPVADGVRAGSSVRLTATSGVDIAMTGDVANGCVMSGHAVASTGYTADWVGRRLE